MPTEPRLILITGATRGLGRALVDAFAAAGHTLIGCGRSTEMIDELRRTYGPPHDFATLDVADDTAVAGWAERLLREIGPPDLLINNAAVMTTPAPLWEIPADEFDGLVDVNIKGVANVIRHVVPAMVARERGVIVNLSSGWGRSTSPGVAPYCASKWAIEGLTRALAQDLPKGMAAVPLNPGIIDTDMLRIAFGDRSSSFLGPEEWAKSAAPFLLGLGPKDNGKPLTVPGQ
jgi:NAD(P)-dependent dehydrogenase (short-subunit alcohol dehydrogenase family)